MFKINSIGLTLRIFFFSEMPQIFFVKDNIIQICKITVSKIYIFNNNIYLECDPKMTS